MERKLLLFISAFIVVLLSVAVVQDFSIPLTHPDGGDTDFWEYMGYYVYRNVSFFEPQYYFLPHIEYNSDQHLYPFGTNHALQGWSLESCFWYAACYKLFGNWGNWLGYYYILTVLITFWGSYLLLRPEFGFTKSFGVAVLVSLFNFYALQRFPYHFSHVVHHWLTLNILLDFVMFRRFYQRKSIPLFLILCKALCLVLVLGLEVGYLVGLALSSFTVTLLFSLVILLYRSRRDTLHHLMTSTVTYRREIVNNRTNIFLALLVIVASFWYIPIIGQLFIEVKAFPPPEIHGNWWTNPLRLLTPLFLSPEPDLYQSIMRDSNEGLLAGTVGWFVLMLAIIGFFRLSKQEKITYLPLITLIGLCLLFHPRLSPTLKVFPWFEYARVPGRSTIIYPTVLALLAIPAMSFPKTMAVKRLYALVAVVGIVEFCVNYNFQLQKKTYQFSGTFRAYMNAVQDAPGEAVLDFPFCIVGGNGIGGEENLAPLFVSNAHVSTFQRFHTKKTIGHYYGRLNTAQIKQQVKLGWGSLMKTAIDDPHLVQKLSSCPNVRQLEQLAKFIKYNDFSGVNLYVDLLPDKACAEQFITVLGQPLATTSVPGSGKVLFIPKKSTWFSEIDKERGKSINFGR